MFTVIDATAAVTLTKEQSPVLVHNVSAGGAVVVTMPTDCDGGEMFVFTGMVAQTLRIEPGAAGGIWATDGTTFA